MTPGRKQRKTGGAGIHPGVTRGGGTAAENSETAKSAGLRYIAHCVEGIQRRRRGKGFFYITSTGKMVRDRRTLGRIAALVIPPAWEKVWICPDSRGHIQAVGCDQRGRKQYLYHAKWREVRDENKYEHMIDFGKALPKIRRRVQRDMHRRGLPREKVLATVIRLLETSLIRVGNEEYARENHSFGLTTMRDKHVQVTGSRIHFEFRGKSGVEHAVDIEDRRLAQIVKACQHLPGQELFQYVDGDEMRHAIGSDDVNAYLHGIAGKEFTAKDFRTWAGTILTAMTLQKLGRFTSQSQAKKNILLAIGCVAERLGNTKAICRKCYIHPAIFDAYLSGKFLNWATGQKAFNALHPQEAAVMVLLREVRPQKRAHASAKSAAA